MRPNAPLLALLHRATRRWLAIGGLALALLPPAQAALPQDYQDFKARYGREASTPEGAIKLYFDAVFVFANPATREEGSKMLRYSLRLNKGWERNINYRTFVERLTDPACAYIFRSYAKGATLQNGYAMSPDDYRLDIIRKWDQHPSGDLQLSLRNAGADNLRTVYLRQYDGLWFISNNASTYVEVRKPSTAAERNAHDADFD